MLRVHSERFACACLGDVAIAAQFGDRIRYIPVSNGGAGVARNRGIAEAQNDLIAFIDSDDEWMPDKLILQRGLMERLPEVLFCFSDFVSRDAGVEQPSYLRNWHQDPRPWHDILGPGRLFSSLAPLPWSGCSTAATRRSAWRHSAA